jgi:SAM-dependent methyltransferase
MSDIRAINNAVWSRGGYLPEYSWSELSAGETAWFERNREALSGRVLELGCGAGRLSARLLETASSFFAIDIAEDMVAHCRDAYPRGSFTLGDLSDLSQWDREAFSAVVGGCNVIDILDDADRGRLLDELHRILVPGGTLLFSSHNLASLPMIKGPIARLPRDPLAALRELRHLPRKVVNRRRLARLEERHDDYAIVNDWGIGYALLHYYIGRDAQQRQLAEHGFELLECLDDFAEVVPPGATAAQFIELYYAARSTSGQG